MKKISKAKIAVTYATALLEAATEKKAAAKVFDDILKLRTVVAADDSFVNYMANPLWSDNDKIETLKAVAAKLKLKPETLRCLDIVLENRRFGELPQILNEYVHLYYKRNHMVEVEVESVKKLSAQQEKKLVTVLENLMAQKTVVTYRICPELIGGLKIRFGSEMFDDTVAAKLSRLEIMMKGEE